MNAIIQILKKYQTYVTTGWFSAEVLSHGSVILKYFYPMGDKTTVYVFENESEFYNADCLETLKSVGFIKVGDK